MRTRQTQAWSRSTILLEQQFQGAQPVSRAHGRPGQARLRCRPPFAAQFHIGTGCVVLLKPDSSARTCSRHRNRSPSSRRWCRGPVGPAFVAIEIGGQAPVLAVELLTPPGGMGRGQHRPGDGTQDSDDVVTAEQQVLIVGRLPVAAKSTARARASSKSDSDSPAILAGSRSASADRVAVGVRIERELTRFNLSIRRRRNDTWSRLHGMLGTCDSAAYRLARARRGCRALVCVRRVGTGLRDLGVRKDSDESGLRRVNCVTLRAAFRARGGCPSGDVRPSRDPGIPVGVLGCGRIVDRRRTDRRGRRNGTILGAYAYYLPIGLAATAAAGFQSWYDRRNAAVKSVSAEGDTRGVDEN